MKATTLSLAISVLTLVAAPAVAGGPVSGKSASGKVAQIAYDWQKPRKAANQKQLTVKQRKQLAARVSYRGRGSYICSPSGLGMRTRCFNR